ncbi:MAG: repeat protein [Candidatus Angelobacter sp.]|nr:repeat protein [Candidatus Angelobacter sp.]
MSIEEHLSAEQIEWFVSESNQITEPEALNGPLAPARRHVSNCHSCSEKVNSYSDAARLLQSLGSGVPPAKTAACPEEIVWFQIAAGTASTEETLANLRHSAQCDHCGQLLKKTISYFADELSKDEKQVIAKLQSSRIGVQLRLAEKLASEQNVNGRATTLFKKLVLLRWPKSYIHAAAIIALVVFPLTLWLYLNQSGTASVDKLLAEAYTQQRTLEFRFPGASYGPVRVERGSTRSRLERPAALLEAETRIKRQLQKDPNALQWLQEKARADLLNGDYSAAIESLSRALETQPESASLLLDMATAYFQRAQSEDRALDFGESIEFLSRALAKDPEDPVLLFNRAIASERVFLYDQAMQDWTHYLRVDPTGDWAKEARERLNKLEEKRKKHDRAALEPLLTPEQIVATKQQIASQAMDARAEEYLDLAIREWLPQAFPSGSSKGNQSVEDGRKALSLLSSHLKQEHQDPWLFDLLAGSSAASFSSGVAAISLASKLNAVGDPTNAAGAAQSAEKFFVGNKSGTLRAKLEKIYALRRAEKANECLSSAVLEAREFEQSSYRWIKTQFGLEQSLCWAKVGNLSRASKGIEAGIRSAREARFRILELRALGLAASLDAARGDAKAVWARDIDGLANYWSGTSPPLRGYQFYSNLSFSLDRSERTQLALIVAREAVASIRGLKQDSFEAMARQRLANAAVKANRQTEAEPELLASQQIFSRLPQNDTTRTYQIDGELALAKLEAFRGALDDSFKRLKRVELLLASVSTFTFPLRYYSTLAQVEQIKGDVPAAERALWSAVSIGEAGLASLNSDRDRLSWNAQMSGVYRELISLKLKTGASSDAFEIWEWFRSASLRTDRLGSARPKSTTTFGIDFQKLGQSAGKVEHFAPEKFSEVKNATIISYAQMPAGLAIWVADNRGVHYSWVPVPHSKMQAAARQFVRDCSSPESNLSDLKQHGKQLYAWLVAPIEPYLEKNRILILQPDAPFSDISVQALVDENGRYFGESFPIAYSFGLGYLEHLRNTEPLQKSAHAFVVGPPALTADEGGAWQALPDAAEEAETVAGKFESAALITGSNATLIQVERGLKQAAVFHFAGHAAETATGAGLLLANTQRNDSPVSNSTILGAEQISTIELSRLNLAVLSACSTAREDGMGGDREDSLVHAFVRARVPNVVASRWRVDSKTSSGFMKSFYTNLLAKNTPAQALQIAEIEASKRPLSAHPYYWGSFSLFGRQ